MGHIGKLPLVFGLQLLNKAIEENVNDKLWERWLVDYSHMDKKTFIPFEKYKDKMIKKKPAAGDDKPDKRAFYKKYGNQIKQPEIGGEAK